MSTAAAPGTFFPDGGKGRLRRGTAEERAAAAGRTGEYPCDCHRIVEHYGRKTTFHTGAIRIAAGRSGAFYGAGCAVFLCAGIFRLSPFLRPSSRSYTK